MIDTPEIVETSAQLMASIQLTIPREEIRHVMEPGLSEILGVLAEQGIEPTGPWFTHHFRMEPGIFDFEICVPVGARVKPYRRVVPGEWPAMTVARTTYRGPYGGLPGAWKEFNEWVASNGRTPSPELWERYVSNVPGAVCTELNRPLL